MKRRVSKWIISSVLLAGMMGGYACAQSGSASPSNRSASDSMKLAGEDAGNAASNAYHGTATAVKDTYITAKVKLALHNDKVTNRDDIHVDTVAGVVTLSGQVRDHEEAERAAQIARSTVGVRDVVNDLRVAASS